MGYPCSTIKNIQFSGMKTTVNY